MELRPHQIKAVDQAGPILERSGVVLLALECRLGKTFCALTLARQVGGRCLFVTKKKAISSVEADSEAMGGWGDDLVVVNYESLGKVKFGGFSVVVIDECHRVSAFPKMGAAAKLLKQACAGAKGVILLSGTPAIESSAQWFHIFHVTGCGPWKTYGSFYRWFKDYGIPEQIRIAGGQLVNSYKKVKASVGAEVQPYAVSMTQAQAGFKVGVEVVPHYIEDGEALIRCEQIKKHGVMKMNGYHVLAENPAAVLQKQAMICGGTVLDEDGDPIVWVSKKLEYLAKKVRESKKIAIFTQYIAERELIVDHLYFDKKIKATDDMDLFKAGNFNIFVGSIKSWCEGVKLDFIDCMVLYSLTFSGSTYSQILERMSSYEREDTPKVHVLMVKDSVEEYIFKAVSEKQSFNRGFYERSRKQG